MQESIGKKMVILRKAKNLTQQEFSDAVGIKRSTISNYEIDRRTPSLHDLEKIAKFYGVGLDFFGVASKDEIMDILARAKRVFANEAIPAEQKEDLYKEMMRLYLTIADKKGK